MKVGIDISKKTLDTAFGSGRKLKHAKFENNKDGFLSFAEWVKDLGSSRPHVCMEATGRYWQDVAQFCFDLGWNVSVVNPRQIRDFANAMLKRHKTDKVDAEVIAVYAERMPLELWTPKTEAQDELQQNQAAIQLTTKTIVQLENFLSSGIQSQAVKEVIGTQIESLRSTLKSLQKHADTLIAKDCELKRNSTLLKSMIGIADTTARLLLSRIDFRRFPNARSLTCYLGLNPRKYSSGTSISKRDCISRIGHADIRSALYFPAMTAMTHDPVLRRFAERLRQAKKPEKVIITAVMRKLVSIAFALLRSGEMYNLSHGLPAIT